MEVPQEKIKEVKNFSNYFVFGIIGIVFILVSVIILINIYHDIVIVSVCIIGFMLTGVIFTVNGKISKVQIFK